MDFPDFPTEIMSHDWTNSDDFLVNDILNNFPMDTDDFLSNFEPDTIDQLSEHIKNEVEDYEMSLNSNKLLNDTETNISSDSGLSDSGLSSDIEPLSPPLISSPESSTHGSEEGSPIRISNFDTSEYLNNLIDTAPAPVIKTEKPKVIVQRVPQIINLSQKNKPTIVSQQKLNNPAIIKPTTINFLNSNKEIKILKLIPQSFTTSNDKRITIQVKNSNTGAKIQANPGTIFINKGEVKKIVKVPTSSINACSQSILLPVSIKNVQTIQNQNLQQNEFNYSTTDELLSDTSDTESLEIDKNIDSDEIYQKSDNKTTNYPKLLLNSEEKRLLAKEGITLPSHYPLTKNEERELKRIRRKIRNKISAQDSRKRKKEYVDGLEERVKQCTEENQTLIKKIRSLQSQNQNLISQMKKLQNLLAKSSGNKQPAAQPTTCLMVLLLSLALIAAPNLNLKRQHNMQGNELSDESDIIQNRRTLLFDQNHDEDIHLGDHLSSDVDSLDNEEFICKKPKFENTIDNHDFTCKLSKTKKALYLKDFEVDDLNWYNEEIKTDEKIESTKFNILSDAFHKNIKNPQTSGFNIIENTKSGSLELTKENLDKFTNLHDLHFDGKYYNDIEVGQFLKATEAEYKNKNDSDNNIGNI